MESGACAGLLLTFFFFCSATLFYFHKTTNFDSNILIQRYSSVELNKYVAQPVIDFGLGRGLI